MRWQVAGGDPYALLSDLLAREEGISPLPLIARRERGPPAVRGRWRRCTRCSWRASPPDCGPQS